jgi:hypothetical protein
MYVFYLPINRFTSPYTKNVSASKRLRILAFSRVLVQLSPSRRLVRLRRMLKFKLKNEVCMTLPTITTFAPTPSTCENCQQSINVAVPLPYWLKRKYAQRYPRTSKPKTTTTSDTYVKHKKHIVPLQLNATPIYYIGKAHVYSTADLHARYCDGVHP